MPKYGPKKSGKERFAREVAEEIAYKENVLARALGVPLSEANKELQAHLREYTKVMREQRDVARRQLGKPEPGRLVRAPDHHAYVIYDDGTLLEVEVEKTINIGRSLLRRLT